MTTYRVVGTGDSILAMTFGVPSPGSAAIIDGTERWLDLEYGRNAYTNGLANRASTNSIWPLVRDRSQTGGWIIIMDNALGVSITGWKTLVDKIRAEAPPDRGLIGITPIFHPRWDPTGTNTNLAATNAAQLIKSFSQHPTSVLIRWDQAVQANPSFVYDGQHPTLAGKQWLRDELERWVAVWPAAA